MALEIERKYLDVDFSRLRAALQDQKAECLGAHLEYNAIYEDAQRNILSSGKLARLRVQHWPDKKLCFFTLKMAACDTVDNFKKREELETRIGDCEIFAGILSGLGFVPVGHYEKMRETWMLPVNGGDIGQTSVLVELDSLPFCQVVEIEGEPAAIEQAERQLGLDKFEISTKSYNMLFQEWRASQNLPPCQECVFDNEKKRLLEQEIAAFSHKGK